jgi:hypothetical protein
MDGLPGRSDLGKLASERRVGSPSIRRSVTLSGAEGCFVEIIPGMKSARSATPVPKWRPQWEWEVAMAEMRSAMAELACAPGARG